MNGTWDMSTLINDGGSTASSALTSSRSWWQLSESISPAGWISTVPEPSERMVIDRVDIEPPGCCVRLGARWSRSSPPFVPHSHGHAYQPFAGRDATLAQGDRAVYPRPDAGERGYPVGLWDTPHPIGSLVNNC